MASRKPVIHGRDHLPGGADPIPFPTMSSNTGSLLDQIIAKAPNGLWKLNESSGNIAHDSSGNGYDLAIVGPKVAPTWGQTAGPPGEQCAGWLPATNQGVELTSYPYLSTGDFTAVGWGYYNDTDPADIYAMIGQGNGAVSFGQGWGLGIGGSSTGYANKLVAWFGHGTSGPFTLVGNNALTAATWYMFALVQSAGSQYISVNGLQQTATGTFTYTNHLGIWIGNDFDVSSAAERMSGRLSYWATFNKALTGAELLAMYNAGTTGGNLPDGEVWTTDGSGSAKWRPIVGSNITVGVTSTEIDLSLPNTGPGATGPIGDATHTPIVTIDAQGRVTALTSAAISGGASSPSIVTSLPGSPSNGDECILTDSTTAPTYQWHLRYDTSITGSHKWRFLGGPPIYAKIPTSGDAGETLNNGTFQDLTTPGPSVTIPCVGLYTVEINCYMLNAAGTVGIVGFTRNGSNPPDDSEALAVGGAVSGNSGVLVQHDFTSIGTSAAVKCVYRTGGSVTFYRRRIALTPVLLG